MSAFGTKRTFAIDQGKTEGRLAAASPRAGAETNRKVSEPHHSRNGRTVLNTVMNWSRR